jgi:hypothetical protein
MLTIPEIKKAIKEKNQSELTPAIQHERKVRFHSETIINREAAGAALTYFLNFVRRMLPRDKYEMFVSLFGYPVSTISLTAEMYDFFGKVFEGRNPVFSYDFVDTELLDDWLFYRNNELQLNAFWRKRGKQQLKSAINSIVIVDLPTEQTEERPTPKAKFLPVDKVLAFKVGENNVFEYLIFRASPTQIAVFDDQFYRVFEVRTEHGIDIKDAPIVENAHDLGYCPARWFWSTPINARQPYIKKSVISDILDALDKLLFFEVSNEHLQLYGRYPIISVFRTDCTFEDQNTGHYCDDGFLRNRDGHYLMTGGSPLPCPVCKDKRLNGAGSIVDIDPPSPQNDKADLRNPVQITGIDRESLDYNNEDIERRRAWLLDCVTGGKNYAINNKAVNEKQVFAVFEAMEAKLAGPQDNFEQIISWTDETICRLRYGAGFVGCSISLGTDHYILSSADLMQMYIDSRAAGLDDAALDAIEDKYLQTEYRNNPDMLQRHKMLNHLDPFRHRSNAEVVAMYERGDIDFVPYYIKLNFSSLIMKFERENTKITNFGANLDFDRRITTISETLAAYAMEVRPVTTQ